VYFLRMVSSQAPQNVHEYLDILQQQITLSEKIVSDLLDFARSKPPQRKPASINDITKAQLLRLGSTNGVRIHSDMPDNVPSVLVDETQIGQIVFNLLTNAMQAMEGKGDITIRTLANEHHLQYEVSDTGPGIKREHLDKVFEPLFTTKARGIGLGLAVSRTLARANNGELTVDSALGRGATFRLTLPLVEESAV
jgi:signal transduction histidine kinase